MSGNGAQRNTVASSNNQNLPPLVGAARQNLVKEPGQVSSAGKILQQKVDKKVEGGLVQMLENKY